MNQQQQQFAAAAAATRTAPLAVPAPPTLVFLTRVEDGRVPQYQTAGAAGLDVHSRVRISLAPGARARVPLGFRLALPPTLHAQIVSRSGLALTHGVVAIAGVIDSDYRGEVSALLLNTDAEATFEIASGDRVAQLLIAPVVHATFHPELVDNAALFDTLPATARSANGFGSTGV